MIYKIEKWTIKKLLDYYEKDKINLSPPYQRNEIWSLKDQQYLIKSIKNNWPIPNFFILVKEDESFEMVDGQQRSRTIIGYWNGKFKDENKEIFLDEFKKNQSNKEKLEKFLKYNLVVIKIAKLMKEESIEEFYALVNSSGLHLNRPELKKAEYFNTKFLELITELIDNNDIKELNIFSKITSERMNDLEFVSELVALIKYGISEKKEKVNSMYELDITLEEYEKLKIKFLSVINIIKDFNSITPIRNTRYRQKNDFYSLYYFLLKNNDLDRETLKYFYKLLVKVSPEIKPYQENCEPFRNYAINCVTQSNSKNAREERNRFLCGFFLNKKNTPNDTQEAIMNFYGVDYSNTKSMSGYTLIDIDKIQKSEEEF